MEIWLLTIEISLLMPFGLAYSLSRSARRRTRGHYIVGAVTLWLVLVAWFGMLAFASNSLRSTGDAYFPQAVTLAATAIFGAGLLAVRGSLQRNGKPRAAGWKSIPLLALSMMLGVVLIMTEYRIDSAAKAFASKTRARTSNAYAELTGPMPADVDNARDAYVAAFARMNKVLTDFDGERAKRANASQTQPTTSPDSNSVKLATELLSRTEADSPDSIELVARLGPALRLLAEIPAESECRFLPAPQSPDLYNLFSSKEVHSNDFRKAALALQTHATQMAHQGKIDEAFADIRLIRRMAGHLDQTEPCLLAGLIREGIESLAIHGLFEVLPCVTDSSELPPDLLPDEAALNMAMDRNFNGEEAMEIDGFLNFAGGNFNSKGADWVPVAAAAPLGLFYRLFWLRPDVDGTHDFMRRQREELATPMVNQTPIARDFGSPMIHILLPSLDSVRKVHLRLLSANRQARIAMALTQYRLKHGSYPPTLSALTPDFLSEIPADPFDNKPMRYRLENGNAIIYSVGKNLKDDGGQIDDERQNDYGFRLSHAAKVK